jgi:hypothetical protein
MSYERDLAPVPAGTTTAQRDDDASPGRPSLTARLDAPAYPLASGLLGGARPGKVTVTSADGSPLGPDLDIGIMPDPLDPFEQPPTDWDKLAAPAAGPEKPAEWVGMSLMPLSPRPKLRMDGKPCSTVTNEQREAAGSVLRIFDNDRLGANTSWNGMITGIAAFFEASKDLEGKGILGSDGGMGWNASDPGADLSKLTGQQKVGPDGNSKSINDVFQTKDGSAGTDAKVDAAGAKGTKKTRETLNSARRAANEAQTAAKEHKTAQTATKGTAEGVRAALLLVEINTAQVAADKLEEQKAHLQKEKDEAIERIDTIIGTLEALVLMGFGIGEGLIHGPAAGAESMAIGALIGAEVIGHMVINAHYDEQIEAADKQLKAAIGGIRSKQGEYVQAALSSAVIAHDAAMGRVRTTREAMLAKIAAYQSAYDAFAEEAGKAAGGGAKGAQVQAALEAVPRVEHCLGQISQVTASIKPPLYTDASGKGFNGFGKPAEFVEHVGQMKGYLDKFKGLETMWRARLTSLKALEKQFGP